MGRTAEGKARAGRAPPRSDGPWDGVHGARGRVWSPSRSRCHVLLVSAPKAAPRLAGTDSFLLLRTTAPTRGLGRQRLCPRRDGGSTFLPWNPTQDPVSLSHPPRPWGPHLHHLREKPEGNVIMSTLVPRVPGTWLLLFLSLQLSPPLWAQSSPVNPGPDISNRKL